MPGEVTDCQAWTRAVPARLRSDPSAPTLPPLQGYLLFQQGERCCGDPFRLLPLLFPLGLCIRPWPAFFHLCCGQVGEVIRAGELAGGQVG